MNAVTTKKFQKSVIATAIVAAFCLAQTCAWAGDNTVSVSNADTKILSSVRHVVNNYNAFGVCYSSTETTTTKTQTTSTVTQGGTATTTTSTTESITTTTSTWKGGSLKADTSITTTNTTGTDTSGSTSTSTTTYSYDAGGKLQGVSGITTGESWKTKDASGNKTGEASSTTVDTYEIRNGQALRTQSVTTTKNYGTSRSVISSTTTDTTVYTYEIVGAAWHLTKEVNTSSTSGTDGSSENVTKTKTYTRDANGVCTGIKQTATGQSVSIDELGGRWVYNMGNYVATFTKDATLGWRLSNETYDWILGEHPDYSSYGDGGGGDFSAEEMVAQATAELYAATGAPTTLLPVNPLSTKFTPSANLIQKLTANNPYVNN